MMRSIILLTCVTATVLGQLHVTLLPTASPAITRDYWMCATHNLTSFFKPPRPTGEVAVARYSYGQALLQEICEPGSLSCPFPAQSRWCAFTDVAPRTLLPAYSSAGKEAHEWLASRKSEMLELAVQCPNYWYKAMNKVLLGDIMLNNTLSMADCYAKEHLGADATSTTHATTPTLFAAARPAPSGSLATTPTPTA